MTGNIILLTSSIFIYIVEWKDIKYLNQPENSILDNLKALLTLIFGSIGIVVSAVNLSILL